VLAKRNIPRVVGLSSFYLFLLFLLLILLVNSQIIYQDLMFPEQPILYLLNQNIHSWSDLLAVYLHPKMLESLNVPFFRPSGHFLLYQLLTPLLGWQNTRGLLVVNFIFLALMGVVLVKIYEKLFPGFKTGAYIAFAICVMHPLFIISRSTIMHFEFASFLFLLLSLYCFMIFCQKNLNANVTVPYQKIQFHDYSWLVFTIANYGVAVTFKETTIMLMPALLVYFYLQLYPLAASAKNLFSNKEVVKLSVLLMLVSGIVAVYMSLAWIGYQHPLLNSFSWQTSLDVLNKYLKIIFGYPYNFFPGAIVPSKGTLWEISLLPWVDSALMLLALFLLPVNVFQVFSSKVASQTKQSLLFLYSSAVLFILLPVLWGHAMPWHAGLTLLFLSLLTGFAFECLLQRYFSLPNAHRLGYGLALLIASSTLWVNQINYQSIFKHPVAFDYTLDRNAIKYPPALGNQLRDDSVIVVEDRMIPHTDYQRGNSVYPFALLGKLDAHRLFKGTAMYVFPYVYGGNMFRWAYGKPDLKEQIYPFRVEEMAKIPDVEIIYNWLQHFNNIFCVGFDEHGQWHDKTMQFKQNLLREQQARHLVVNRYQAIPATALSGRFLVTREILLPDSMVCKQMCDNSKYCAGFTYRNVAENQNQVTACHFYQTIASAITHCQQCTGYIKESV
jgi:hypothetical protein